MIIAICVIGYFIIGLTVFWVESKLDGRYRSNLMAIDKETQGIRETIEADIPYWASGYKSLDEYHRRTQYLPKNKESLLKKRTMILGLISAFLIVSIWPIIAIISPIYNTIVYVHICHKVKKELA